MVKLSFIASVAINGFNPTEKTIGSKYNLKNTIERVFGSKKSKEQLVKNKIKKV